MHIAKPRRYPHPASSKRCFTGDKANSSSVSACLDHESVAAPSHQLSTARARGQFKREDNDVLSHDHSIRNEPQHFGKRVELQRPQAQVAFQKKTTAKRSRHSNSCCRRTPSSAPAWDMSWTSAAMDLVQHAAWCRRVCCPDPASRLPQATCSSWRLIRSRTSAGRP